MLKKIKFLCVMVMAALAITASAQVTTSALTGKVTLSDDNEAVIGATVRAVHVPSGTRYSGVTNERGRYTIQGMRVGGPYTVEISYVGYNTQKVDNLTLTLGETSTVNAVLEVGSRQLQEVVVTGKAGIDATKTGAAMSFSAKDIAMIPSTNHSIADVTRLNPMVNISQSGAMSFAGVSNRYNSFMVDGAVNNDVFGLTSNGQNGGQAGTQPLSMETVEQIQVQVAPFDVRQSGFTGGSINAITKSGTNEFHGSVYGDYMNKDLISDKYVLRNGKTSSPYQDEKNYHYGVTLGGPIVKDKLFFFANYEKSMNEYSNNYGLGSEASRVDAAVAQDLLTTLQEAAKRQGVEYNGTFNNPNNYTKSDKAGVKLDWNINDKHKLTLGWRLVYAKQLNGNSSATYLDATDYQYDFKSVTNSFTAELHSNFSPTVSNEALLSYVRVRDSRSPYGMFPMLQIGSVGSGSVCFGTERSSTANALDQDIISFTDNVTLYKGNHTFTFGTHDEYYKFANLFIQDNYGTYYFATPDDFKAALNGEPGHIKQYRFGMANVDVTGDPRWKAAFSAGQLGFYAQDKWEVTNNFQLTYGVRIDVPLFFDTPTANTEFNEYAASKGWDVRTDHKLKSTPMFSPRLGFRWKVDEDKKVVLRGGAGLFTGRIPFVWLSNNFSNTGIQLSTYNVSGNNVPSDLSVILDKNRQQENAAKLKAAGSQTINVFADDFKFAQTLRLNLAMDATWAGIDWTFEGVWSKTINDVVYRNLAYEWDGKTTLGDKFASLGFDQRPYLQKITTGTPFSNIYLLDNTSKGHTLTLSGKAEKKFNFGLTLAASYTFTNSKSVNYGGSSVAQSNFNYNYTRSNPNDPEVGRTAYNTPHKINVSAFYNRDYAKHWNTSVGLIYTCNSGSPYSIYYYGDLNSDSSNGNDLFYIPTDAEIDQMQFKKGSSSGVSYDADMQRTAMKAWIAGDSYLRSHRGEYFERFADNEEFEHHFDFHFAQTYKFRVGKMMHSLQLTFNIQNLANLFNKKWGHYTSTGSSVYYSPVTYSGNGQFQFLHGYAKNAEGNVEQTDYDMRSYSDYYSRWRAQIGLKYTF